MEKDWLKRLKSGDELAFKECVESHKDKVLNTCYYFVHNTKDAEDLAQEVFIQVYHSVDKFRQDANFSTWIYRIAVNKSLDFLRKQKRRKRFALISNLFHLSESEKEVDLPAAGNPHSDLEQKERTKLLNHVIDSLPENQKITITLGKYQGLRNKEIAEILDISVSAVDSLMHRAKKNIHTKLYKYFKNNL